MLVGGGRASGSNKSVKLILSPSRPRGTLCPHRGLYEVVQACSYQPVPVLCQVTNALAQVTLHWELAPKEVPMDETDVSFSSFIIFLLKYSWCII